MKLRLLTAGLIAAGVTFNAQAGSLASNIVQGVLNTFEDQSREVLVDVDGDGFVSTGDVFMGFLRLDGRTIPNAEAFATTELYFAFANEVGTITPDGLGGWDLAQVTPTTAGLTIADALGNPAGLSNTAMVALYSDIANDLVNTNISAGTNDWLTQLGGVLTGTFEGSAGLVNPQDDWNFNLSGASSCLLDLFTLTAGGTANCGGLALTTGATLSLGFGGGTFETGLGVIDNNTGLTFTGGAPSCVNGALSCPINLAGATFHDFSAQNGSVSGACDIYGGNSQTCQAGGGPAATNPMFGVLTAGGQQYNYYGFTNNADISTVAVPEPHAVLLMGIGLLGLAAGQYRRRAKGAA